MKKLLMLGGSNCQKTGILKAKEMGFDVIVADISENPLGIIEGVTHERVSTFDVKGCLRVAKNHGVKGVMTMGTDQPVLTASHIQKELGLPGFLDVNTALLVTDKVAMKERLKEKKIPTCSYYTLKENEKIRGFLKGPVVIKPSDSQGQRGVFLLECENEVKDYLALSLSFSRTKEVVVEEYYPSSELTVSAFVKDNDLTILTVTDRLHMLTGNHIGIAGGHRYPTVHKDRYDEIESICKSVQEGFNITKGPLYIQLLLGDKGIVVNEVAARLGGAFEDIFIPKVTGFDILESVIKGTMGEELNTLSLRGFDFRKTPCEAFVKLMFSNKGTINYMTPLEKVNEMKDVVSSGYNFKEGYEVKEITDATQRVGYTVFVNCEGTLNKSVESFQKSFKILNKEGENLYRSI